MLELATLARHGEGELAETAATELSRLRLDEMLTGETADLDLENTNYDTLIRREHTINKQVTRFSRDMTSHSATKQLLLQRGSLPKRRKITTRRTGEGIPYSATKI